MQRLRKIIENIYKNKVLQIIILIIFMIPLLATIGQYVDSRFIFKKSSFSLLFWPGSDKSFRIYLPVWLTFEGMVNSYL